MRILHLATLVAIALAGFAVPATAQERDNLTGIGPVRVQIVDINPDAARDGLTTTMLQTTVELRLRQNSVPLDDAARPYISVYLIVTKGGGLYAFSLSVSLLTAVQVVATGRITDAPIWTKDSVGTVGADNVRQFVREAVLNYVDEFSNDYLAVNPG